jgi:hypothetical protein
MEELSARRAIDPLAALMQPPTLVHAQRDAGRP